MLTLKYKFNLVTFLNYFNFCLSNTKMRGEGKEGGGEGGTILLQSVFKAKNQL